MAETREASITVAGGMQEIGKTHLTKLQIEQYARGNPMKGINPRKVLILDANDEYPYLSLSMDNVAKFSAHPTIEIRRIRPFHPDGTTMTNNELAKSLGQITKEYKGGLLLVEDINKYVSDSLPQDVIGAICTVRHRACDVIIHMQSVGRIVPKMWNNIKWVRFHKHLDSMEMSKDKLTHYYELFRLAEYIVDKQFEAGNIRHHLYLDLKKVKLVGDYTKQMLLDAIRQYMEDDFKVLVNPMLNKMNLDTGQKSYDFQSAVAAVRDKLYMKYYGNNIAAPRP